MKIRLLVKTCLYVTTLLLVLSSQATIKPISQAMINEMIAQGTYQPACPVPPRRLREVQFNYVDFHGKVHHNGSMTVMDAIAKDVEAIVNTLYQRKFPLHKAQRLSFYAGDDEASMRDNNSSSFNCRAITGTQGNFSLHAYGVAIDINPIQNPYIAIDEQQGTAQISPQAGWHYLNRDNQAPGMAETVTAIFRQHGLGIWGGHWHTPIDWQHFQPSRTLAQLLAAMSSNDANIFFAWYKQNAKFLNALSSKDHTLTKYYQQNPQKFMRLYGRHHKSLNNSSDPTQTISQFKQWWG